jgi:hypothetical protein
VIGSGRKTKVLVLGNDPQINSIDFDRLQPDVLTLGVNRIWLKHIPNYFFFHDMEILTELERNPEAIAALQSSSTVFSSDWIKHGAKRTVPYWIEVQNRKNKHDFPDSVTTSINLFSTNILGHREATYYLAGVSLKWTNPSHFWKELDHDSLNRHDADWYGKRFDRISDNFKKLKAKGLKMISVNPNSSLNKIFRYESINNLYIKR